MTRILVLSLCLAALGCSKEWVPASATFLPNPILLGPVERVHQPPGAPPADRHDVPIILADMWEEDSSKSTTGIGTSVQTTSKTTFTHRAAGYQLGVEILDKIAPHSFDAWQEPYRTSDVLHVEGLDVTVSKSEKRGFGHSESHAELWVSLVRGHLFHMQPVSP